MWPPIYLAKSYLNGYKGIYRQVWGQSYYQFQILVGPSGPAPTNGGLTQLFWHKKCRPNNLRNISFSGADSYCLVQSQLLSFSSINHYNIFGASKVKQYFSKCKLVWTRLHYVAFSVKFSITPWNYEFYFMFFWWFSFSFLYKINF